MINFGDFEKYFSEKPIENDDAPYIKNFVVDSPDDFFKQLDLIDEKELDEAIEKIKPKKKSRSKPRKLAVIDCETDPFEFGADIKPFIWGFYDGDRYIEFTKTRHLVKFLRKFRGYIFGHNGGKFDYHFILDYLDYGQKILLINGRLSQFTLGESLMLDSFNIIPLPLAKMQKDEIDYAKMHRKVRHLYIEEIRRYLKSDCVYLYEYVEKFIKTYGYNITLAGAAMKFWRGKLSVKNKRPRQRKYAFDFLKAFYYGGRVSPFEKGVFDGHFKMYDINSAYPKVMRDKLHPISTNFYKVNGAIKDSEMEKTFIELDCYSAGAFPVRKDNGGIDFPHAFGTYFITGFEFISAINCNSISKIKIRNAYQFYEYINFAEYIDYFFELKKNAKTANDNAQYLFAKLMMNSLYGKFASDYSKYKEYIIDAYGSVPPVGFLPDGICGNHQLFMRSLDETEQNFLNVATSASITGAVRAFLWESINKCKDVFYCDTDSIICRDGSQLDVGDELGQWSLEVEGNKLAIGGKKLYCLWLDEKYQKEEKGKVKLHKIASKGAKLNADEIERICSGETITWQNMAPTFNIKTGYNYIERKIRCT